MFRLFADLVDRYRRFWFALLVVVTVAAGFAATTIRYDFRPQALFAGSDDLVRYSEEFHATFGHEDAVLLIVAEATEQGRDTLDRDLLAWQAEVYRQLVAEFKDTSLVDRIDAVVTLKLPYSPFAPTRTRYVVGALERLKADAPVVVAAEDEQRLRAVIAESKLLKGSLVSDDLRVSAIAVTVAPRVRKIELTRDVMQRIDRILKRHPIPAGYRLHLSGLPAIRADIVEHMQRDQLRLVPLMSLLFFVVMLVIFRHPVGAILPLVAVGVGLIATVGLLAALGQSFNLISNVLPLLLLIIGVSASVHVVARYVQEVEDSPDDRRRATHETITHMAVACLLASLTTAIGFLSIAVARSEVLRDFGWQAALGMAMLYVSTMLVLGVALPWFRPQRLPADVNHRYSPTSHAVAVAGYAVARHPWPTLIVSLAVFGSSLWVARDCRINSYLLETFDADNPTLQTLVMVEDKLSGVIPLEISLDADDHQRFLAPRNFKAIYDFQQFAVTIDAVTSAQSYVNLFQELYWKARRTSDDRDRLPSLDAAGAERIEFCEQRIMLSPRVFNYHAFMTKDGRRARILLRMRDAGTLHTLEVVEQLESKLRELLPADSGITFRLTGDAYVSAKAMDRFIRDIFYSLGAAAAVIFVIIGLLFGSLRLGVVAVLPNLTPLAVTLGYMGLRGYEMNASNVIVFSISLGIAVDNTIHFMARFREEIRKTDDAAWAVEQTYEGTGKAIVLTTLLIIVGLSVLLFSEFVPTRRVAELIGVSMTAALLGDLLLLPACLVLFWKKPSRPPVSFNPKPQATA